MVRMPAALMALDDITAYRPPPKCLPDTDSQTVGRRGAPRPAPCKDSASQVVTNVHHEV